ncbi:MAG: hypothetical protein HY553_07445 [Elusimicrobia bacterium]|nr:hypothetical protein [Elusimicrobiota bacterium]
MSPFDFIKDKQQRALFVIALLTVGAGLGIEVARWLVLTSTVPERDVTTRPFASKPKRARTVDPFSLDRIVGLLARARNIPPAEAQKFAEAFLAEPELEEAWTELGEVEDVQAFKKKLEKSKGFGALASSARFGTLAAALTADGELERAGANTGFFGLGGSKGQPVLLASSGPSRKVKVETPGGPVLTPAGGTTERRVAPPGIAGSGSGEGLGANSGKANTYADKGGTGSGGGGGPSKETPEEKPPPVDPPGPHPRPDPEPRPDEDPKDPRDSPRPEPRDREPRTPRTSDPGGGFQLPDVSKMFGDQGQGEQASPGDTGPSSTRQGKPEPDLPTIVTRESGSRYIADYADWFAETHVPREHLQAVQSMGETNLDGILRMVKDAAPLELKDLDKQRDKRAFLIQKRKKLIDDGKQHGSLEDELAGHRHTGH